ncbi:MAG: protein tyrosine phosphatase [Rhodobacterales bacterium]|jgi:protein tyrosine/serine phosphatase|nr:protein tyrosine phosphatase [Pseudomonadota bacterium]MDA1286857.1 protein tyrosine phosphatase [Pseudomonadota bacterium]NQW15416.1 protein tyrosine phosphatase [Rhodobacter sp.]HBN31583.1 protein tyrosine phosphatase [Paracoccaceae bacterium]
MFAKFVKTLEDKERAWRESFGDDISTPEKRRQAQRHFDWVDHGVLRKLWTNFYPVADGVFRSNQPSAKRLLKLSEMGMKSVLNLRGTSPYSYHLFEVEACRELGLGLTDINLSATALPSLATLLELECHFKTLERPFVMHCKSGADRAGFASALYLLLIKGAPIEVAQKQLGLKYLHIKASSKGILDFCLETYRLANAAAPIAFRDWMMTAYDPVTITAAFQARSQRRRAG